MFAWDAAWSLEAYWSASDPATAEQLGWPAAADFGRGDDLLPNHLRAGALRQVR